MKCKLFKFCPSKLVKEFEIMEFKSIISNLSSKHNLKEYIVVSYKLYKLVRILILNKVVLV